MILYTDGVVEVRGEALDEGLERLRRLAEREHANVETLCDAIIEEMVADGRPADDVAILAVRLVPLGEHIVTHWPADADVLANLRHLLRRWLRQHGATDDEIYDITVAVPGGVRERGRARIRAGGQAFEVEATRTGRDIEVAIRDHGQWRRARGRTAGGECR